MTTDREGGYIKIHRRVRSSPVWQALRADQRWVTVEILLAANWKPSTASWHGRMYEVARGELAHTLATIAERAGVSVKVVRSTVAVLLAGAFLEERYPMPGTGPGTGPRVLKVLNYEKFQDAPDDDGHGFGHGSGTDQAQREEGEEGEEEKHAGRGEQRDLLSTPVTERPRPEPSTIMGRWIREKWPDVVDPDGLLRRLREAHPGVDVERAVRAAWAWEQEKPAARRKKNHERFVTNWLGNERPDPRAGPPVEARPIFDGLDAEGRPLYRGRA